MNDNPTSQLTVQEMFDTVVAHLIQQGVPSVDDTGVCMYRGPNNTKCAIGCLIPNENYDESFEGRSVFYSVVRNSLPFHVDDPMMNLLSSLQNAHDSHFESVEMLKKKLKKIGEEYNLITKVVE